MNYKIYILFLLFISSCTQTQNIKKELNIIDSKYSNRGFAMVYDINNDSKNLVSKKIDERSMIIFQKNLKKGAFVKIKNLINGKSIIANVGQKAIYPSFYNSVLSKRISIEIDLDLDQPYVEIEKIGNNSSFIAKKAKTFDEEKKVADKAPVDGISVSDLGSNSKKKKPKKKLIKNSSNSFSYIVKIADFYFESSAKMMKKRILDEIKIKDVKITKISSNNYRVYVGPYKNINQLKNSYNAVSQLEFENIEIIKK